MKEYDEFKTGDRVWSEAYGFGIITDEDPYNSSVTFKSSNKSGIDITVDGRLSGARNRPRTFFHAIAETDNDMLDAIERGEGVFRVVPRGRWPIQPGDRVMIVCKSGHTSTHIADKSDNKYLQIWAGPLYYSYGGKYNIYDKFPVVMRLYDGEKPFENDLENMKWIIEEAVKFDWSNKYPVGV
ncbi:hypothetical protein [Microcystis phage Mel-JY01]